MTDQSSKDKAATIIHNEYLECRERIYQGFEPSDEVERFNNFARGVMTITKINNDPIEQAELEISESNKFLHRYSLIAGSLARSLSTFNKRHRQSPSGYALLLTRKPLRNTVSQLLLKN